MTSKKKKDRLEVLVGSQSGCKKVHVVVYIDGKRFTMSTREAGRLRKQLKKAVRYIREHS